jgi:co-chaperonin GroES (HSP10)
MKEMSVEAVAEILKIETLISPLSDKIIVRTDEAKAIEENGNYKPYDPRKEKNYVSATIISIGKLAATESGLKVGQRIGMRHAGGSLIDKVITKENSVVGSVNIIFFISMGFKDPLVILNN